LAQVQYMLYRKRAFMAVLHARRRRFKYLFYVTQVSRQGFYARFLSILRLRRARYKRQAVWDAIYKARVKKRVLKRFKKWILRNKKRNRVQQRCKVYLLHKGWDVLKRRAYISVRLRRREVYRLRLSAKRILRLWRRIITYRCQSTLRSIQVYQRRRFRTWFRWWRYLAARHSKSRQRLTADQRTLFYLKQRGGRHFQIIRGVISARVRWYMKKFIAFTSFRRRDKTHLAYLGNRWYRAKLFYAFQRLQTVWHKGRRHRSKIGGVESALSRRYLRNLRQQSSGGGHGYAGEGAGGSNLFGSSQYSPFHGGGGGGGGGGGSSSVFATPSSASGGAGGFTSSMRSPRARGLGGGVHASTAGGGAGGGGGGVAGVHSVAASSFSAGALLGRVHARGSGGIARAGAARHRFAATAAAVGAGGGRSGIDLSKVMGDSYHAGGGIHGDRGRHRRRMLGPGDVDVGGLGAGNNGYRFGPAYYAHSHSYSSLAAQFNRRPKYTGVRHVISRSVPATKEEILARLHMNTAHTCEHNMQHRGFRLWMQFFRYNTRNNRAMYQLSLGYWECAVENALRKMYIILIHRRRRRARAHMHQKAQDDESCRVLLNILRRGAQRWRRQEQLLAALRQKKNLRLKRHFYVRMYTICFFRRFAKKLKCTVRLRNATSTAFRRLKFIAWKNLHSPSALAVKAMQLKRKKIGMSLYQGVFCGSFLSCLCW
jgi:hypothetical protein